MVGSCYFKDCFVELGSIATAGDADQLISVGLTPLLKHEHIPGGLVSRRDVFLGGFVLC